MSRHDGDERSPAGPELGTSSLNGVGDPTPGVHAIHASWKTLVVPSSNDGDASARGKILGNSHLDSDGCSGAWGETPRVSSSNTGRLLCACGPGCNCCTGLNASHKDLGGSRFSRSGRAPADPEGVF